MPEILSSLLSAALSQPLNTSGKVMEEARENLFYLNLTQTELSTPTAPAITAWLEMVLAGKRQQLLAQRGNHYPMQFYCWHDAMATQLRFSLVAAAVALPFGCAFRVVELPVIVQDFLAQEYLLFDENLFEPAAASIQQEAAEEFALPVWRIIIP